MSDKRTPVDLDDDSVALIMDEAEHNFLSTGTGTIGAGSPMASVK